MKIEIVKRELDYYVLEVKSRSDNKGNEYLTWDYSNASYFIVMKLNVDYNLSQINTKSFIEKMSINLSEAFDINGRPCQGEYELDDNVKISLISLNQYKRTNSYYYEPEPMKVVVLCGELRDETLRIHMPDDITTCSTFVPEKIKIKVRKEKNINTSKGFLERLFKQQEQPTKDVYAVKISALNPNYKDGIYYKIKGSKISYPITRKMSSAIFKVQVPIGKELEFYVEKKKSKEYVLSIVYE